MSDSASDRRERVRLPASATHDSRSPVSHASPPFHFSLEITHSVFSRPLNNYPFVSDGNVQKVTDRSMKV